MHALTSPDALRALIQDEGVRTVVNCIGLAEGSGADLEEANVAIPTEVGQVCRRSGAQLLHVGSAAEYGPPLADSLSEHSVARPATPYGQTKLAGTQALLALAALGLEVTVVRPFNLIGPAQPASTPVGEFARCVAALQSPQGDVPVRDPRLVRDYLSRHRAAELVLDLAGVEARHVIVNICSGRGISFRELIVAMGKHVGSRVRIVHTARESDGIRRMVGDPSLLHQLVGIRHPEPIEELVALAMRLGD